MLSFSDGYLNAKHEGINWFEEHQQMNIHVIAQVKQIQEFDVIQVLFKPSWIFDCFDWYNSHSRGEDVEWKVYITV